MKKLVLVLFSLVSVLTHSASAQEAGKPLDQLYSGYQATVLDSPATVNNLFSQMPTDFKKGGFLSFASQCYQRAEVWSYDLYKNKNINGMKVFIFYTAAYKRAYLKQFGKKFAWWFHVAPYVLNKDAQGNIAESVLDPVFSKTPLSVYDWSQLFVDTHKTCKEYVRYQDFEPELVDGAEGAEHCYLVRVPMSDYDPVSVENRDAGKVTGYDWDMDQVNFAVNHAVVGGDRKEMRTRLGL